MLVVALDFGDCITIGPGIVVRVVGCDQSGRARLAIDAPRDLVILRDSLIAPEKMPPRLRSILSEPLVGEWWQKGALTELRERAALDRPESLTPLEFWKRRRASEGLDHEGG